MLNRNHALIALHVLIILGLTTSCTVLAADWSGYDVAYPSENEVWSDPTIQDILLGEPDPWSVDVKPLEWPYAVALADPPKDAQSKEAAKDDEGGAKSLAQKAVDPTAILKQMQFQSVIVPESYGASGSSNQFILQPVLPIPKSDRFPLTQIIRPTLPYISTADPYGPLGEEDAWGDLSVLDLFTKKCDFGTVGIGASLVFPTATSKYTGQGKYQAGPAFVTIIDTVPKWTLGVLAYNPISFAGDDDRDEVSTLNFQPIAIRHFDEGWYAGFGDIQMTYEWHSDQYAVPLSFKLGKVTKICGQPVNLFVEPFYTPWHDGPTPEWGAKLSLTLLFP